MMAGGASAASHVPAPDHEYPYAVVDLNGAPGDIEIKLDSKGKAGDSEKFIYLKSDVGAGAPVAPGGALAAAPKAGAVPPSGADLSGLLGNFTPSHANLRMGIASVIGDVTHQRPGFDLALTSGVATDGAAAFDPLGVYLSPAEAGRRAVNFGFSVGYGGFNLDAAYLQGERGLDYGYRGYDVGLGYQSGNWGTILAFSGLQPLSTGVGMDLMGTQSQYTMRLGAFYQVTPGLTFGGRLQFHDYRLFDSEQSQNRSEFFLNTNLNF